MKTTVNWACFRDAFENAGRGNQFSYEALELLFDYMEEVDEDWELDVIALCCDYSEDTVADIAENYSIDVSGCEDEDEAQATVLEYLNEQTSVLGETNEGILYLQF